MKLEMVDDLLLNATILAEIPKIDAIAGWLPPDASQLGHVYFCQPRP
jgi:hypothetical protein